MKKASKFITQDLTVKWSHLHKPDDKFGADTSNHNITVVVDESLKNTLDTIKNDLGAKKINGMKEDNDDGTITLKAKTKLYAKDNVMKFPCLDSQTNKTDDTPTAGDIVRLKLAPVVIDRDNSVSFFLNGVQIIEKNATEDNGFTPTEGGYVAAQSTSQQEVIEEQEEDDLPF